MTKEKKDLVVFGFGLGIIAAIFGLGGLHKHGPNPFSITLIICSVVFTIVTALNWQALKPGYKAWMKVAGLIGSMVTTVILSIVFFLIFTPISWLLKLIGRDHLARNFSKKDMTYWIKRAKNDIPLQQYHQQF